jgi:hypothetical protein
MLKSYLTTLHNLAITLKPNIIALVDSTSASQENVNAAKNDLTKKKPNILNTIILKYPLKLRRILAH